MPEISEEEEMMRMLSGHSTFRRQNAYPVSSAKTRHRTGSNIGILLTIITSSKITVSSAA
jgi:hypothetical protein